MCAYVYVHSVAPLGRAAPPIRAMARGVAKGGAQAGAERAAPQPTIAALFARAAAKSQQRRRPPPPARPPAAAPAGGSAGAFASKRVAAARPPEAPCAARGHAAPSAPAPLENAAELAGGDWGQLEAAPRAQRRAGETDAEMGEVAGDACENGQARHGRSGGARASPASRRRSSPRAQPDEPEGSAPSAEAPADEEADDDSDSDWSGSSDGEASAGGPPSGRAGLKHGRSANRPTGSRRLRWSVAEEQALRDGIAKFGLGKWRAIQKDPNFGPILTIRSNGDLKDKWRNLCKEEAKVAKVAQIGDQRKAADKAASAAASAGADGNAYVAAAPTSDGEASAGEGAQEAGDGYDEHGLDAEGLSKYERERLARIAANHARMEAMLGHSLRAAEVAAAASKPKARARPRKRAKRSEGEEPAQLLRRSARRCAQALPPRDARELTLETLRAAEQGAALEIYWPEDAAWYDATLTVARPETNEWDIRYPEDGVEETLRLSDPELPPVRPRGCAAAVSNAAQGDALLPEELTMAEHSRAVCAAADARGAQVASMTTIGSHSVATMRANGQLEVWTLPADGMDRGAIRISGTRVPGYNTEERFVACKIGASECGSFVAVGNGVGDTYVYAVDVPGMPKQVGHAPANKRARSPVVAATITGRGTRVLSASGKGFIWRYEPDPGETKKNTSGAWAGQL